MFGKLLTVIMIVLGMIIGGSGIVVGFWKADGGELNASYFLWGAIGIIWTIVWIKASQIFKGETNDV